MISQHLSETLRLWSPLPWIGRSAEFVEFVADGEVALAGGCLQAVAVHDGDAAPGVADESGLLESPGALGDRGAADAEHLGEESQHGLGVAMQQVVQGAVAGQEPAQSDSVEPKSLSWDLAEAPMRAGRGAEERR